ncbi:MAG: F0F1 ATP synthase subunit A [Candidatus Fournierella pullistercoris]|uniref:ATP synthase subunit a n=1 Tax=Candidatus Allofournierella pullistercoris TaxID=2838597 RepID=A0A948WUI4_9FIRM|nr:F0F1 ATP synthase subunit A [Candidatus Fournierella pullistercoris]
MNIKEELMHALENKTAFEIPLFGGIPVPESAVASWILIAGVTLVAIWLTHNMKKVPGRKQMVAETLVGFMNNFCKEHLGHHWRTYAPILGTMGIYLVLANLSEFVGIKPPTKDLNVTAGMAVISTVLVYGSSFMVKGLKGGLKKFAEPSPIVAPLNILEIGIRPLSLCMRLFGNVFASFVIMELVKIIAPAIVPIPLSLYFDAFDGIIQAVVFVFLTTLFLSEAIE